MGAPPKPRSRLMSSVPPLPPSQIYPGNGPRDRLAFAEPGDPDRAPPSRVRPSEAEEVESRPFSPGRTDGTARRLRPLRDDARARRPADPEGFADGAPSDSFHDLAGTDRDLLDLYYADLAGRRPLTREGEVAVGRRIESAEHRIVDAWLGCPLAAGEIGRMAEDVQQGVLTLDDLLTEIEVRDGSSPSPRVARLAGHLDRLGDLAFLPAGPARAALVADLVDLRLDAAVGERIERCLRAAAGATLGGERDALLATLAEIGRAQRAVARAKAELVEANLRLSVTIARQFRRSDVPLVDLAQEGNLGLIRAADRFDYRRGHRFSTYAVWWIKQSIRRAILRQGEGLRIPAHLAEARSRAFRVRRDFLAQHGRDPTAEEVATRAGLSLDRLRAIDELSLQPLRLDAPVGDDGDTSLGELVAGESLPADEILARRRLVEDAHALVDSLNPREREVIIRRFGLHDREDETLEEIGRSASLTRERIRQVEAAALAKLRTRSRRR
jgi:RNA polymerase primary sigma factor